MPPQEFDKVTSTGWGLLSSSGIPKPVGPMSVILCRVAHVCQVYRAFELLHRAGNLRHPVTPLGPQNPDAEVLVTTDFEGAQIFFLKKKRIEGRF